MTVCRFADASLFWDLADAAKTRLLEAVDPTNAPSLLAVARDLDDDRLRRTCLARIVTSGLDDARAAAGPDLFDAVLPAETHDRLRKLASLAASNPLQCGAALTDAREALAMLREALDDMTDRLISADDRQTLAEDDLERRPVDARESRRVGTVRRTIDAQRTHVDFLRDFLSKQEKLFNEASDCVDADGDLIASYDWRFIPANAKVPPGLEIKLSFQGQQAIGRIPPTWQLRVYLDSKAKFFRTDVTADTRVRDVLDALKAAHPDATFRLLGKDGTALDDDRRFDARLFRDQRAIRVAAVS